ncbi:MAG: UDP-2,3-diacylglucosamine diphosphatase LpxI [Caulobacteraceae bacterium]|nr:UDP-2,3-diacylglucosamine diphosphatase LpxI [Caulobacteraceae bacterium]
MRKLGLIAGGGGLPVTLAGHCRAVGRPVFVIRLRGFADPALADFEGVDAGIAELGKGIGALRRSRCETVCFAGKVERPDLRNIRPDLRGLAALPGAIAAASKGDDALLAFLLQEFEKEGFSIEGAHQVMADLTLGEGPLGRHAPGERHLIDIHRALDAARAVGRLDAGQAAVSCDGLILALEAQEGTDALLERVAGLPAAIRGGPDDPRGVLAKACKPGQELRVDLPTIGPGTIRRAAAAGLAGIVGEPGRLLVLERDETIRLADELGLFIFGEAP